MRRVLADPLLRSLADIPNIEQTLTGMLTQLDVCQKALFQFLEVKRSLFPRCAAALLTAGDLKRILG